MRPIQSSAFPHNKNPPVLSKVHQQLERHLLNHPLPQARIRRHEVGDIQQLKNLQKEWFPLNYSQQFYAKILQGMAECFVAEITLIPEQNQKPVRAIAGAIVFQITSETDYLVDNWFSRMLSLKDNAIYIMTLGVIDQMRSKGIAKRLLEQTIEYSLAKPQIKIISLHVVAYNKRAIHFYRKNGFVLLQNLEEHYHIMGQEYSGLKLGCFVNGGQRREGWLPWIKRVILRNNRQQQWPL